MALAEVQDRL